VIQNSQCKLHCVQTTVSASGSLLTVKWRIEFKQLLANKVTPGSTLKAWMCVIDKNGAGSAWVPRGEYTF